MGKESDTKKPTFRESAFVVDCGGADVTKLESGNSTVTCFVLRRKRLFVAKSQATAYQYSLYSLSEMMANDHYREMKHQLPGNETPNYRDLKHLLPGNETPLGPVLPGNETLFGHLSDRNHWRIRRLYLCIVLTNYNNRVVVLMGVA